MLNLNDIRIFVQVVDHGGFAPAGRALSAPKATLSQRVQEIEARLGARLLNRSTRTFSLTAVGDLFYSHAIGVVRHAEAAEMDVRSRVNEPSGTVRFVAPIAMTQFILRPLLCEFMQRYPKVNLFEYAENGDVDLVAGNFDLAILSHGEPLPDSSQIQRKLATAPWRLFASQNYLAESPSLRHPKDLQVHACLFVKTGAAPGWRLMHESGEVEAFAPSCAPRYVSDSLLGLLEMTKHGAGVVALPGYLGAEALRQGSLARVLPQWTAGSSNLTAVMPDRRGQLPSVRAFVDHLATGLPKAIAA